MRRSQSQAIPTNDEVGLSSRAGSNWTLAEGGVPHRMSGARPKKRKAPPPPPPVSVAATAPPLDADATIVRRTEVPPDAAPPPEGVEVTTNADVPAKTKSNEQPVSLREESPKSHVTDTSSPEEVVVSIRAPADDQGDGGQRTVEGVAPLAEGEDTAAFDGDSAGDVSRHSEEARPQVEAPSLEAAVLAVGESEPNNEVSSTSSPRISEDHLSTDVDVPMQQEMGNKEVPQPTANEEISKDVSEDTNAPTLTDSTKFKDVAEKESVDNALVVGAHEEELLDKSPVMTVTIQVSKETIGPVVEGSVAIQESISSPEEEEDKSHPATEPHCGEQVLCAMPSQTNTANAPDQSTAEDREGSAVDVDEQLGATQKEPKKSALETFRQEYLAEHYKRSLPVLQIKESDLVDDKTDSPPQGKNEDLTITELASALPVLYISEEDLRDPTATKVNDDSGVSAEDTKRAEEGEDNAVVQRTTSRRSLDSGGSVCKEPPQPPTRHSAAQELNSKIYFRVLPPLDRGGATPQLKTFASPSSPPGRRVKPKPPVRNGVAAAHQNDLRISTTEDASPPRTKSPLPTPRRRHQQTATPVSDV